MPPVARDWSTSARIRNLSGSPMIRLDVNYPLKPFNYR